jgi:hypothetical protein
VPASLSFLVSQIFLAESALAGTTIPGANHQFGDLPMNSSSLTHYLHCLRLRMAHDAFAGHDERQLLDRFASENDEAAFACLLQRHGPMVLAICRRVLGNEQDA